MGQNPSVSSVFLLFQFVLIGAIFYFIWYKPQKKEAKEREKMLNALVKNTEVVTNSGIHGTIVNVKDKTMILRVDDNVKIEIEKNCIAYVKKSQGATQGS